MKIKTGIFGGTFNPIHNGHITLARTLLKEAELDEVWFVVSPQNPWKQNQTLLDDNKRLEMVQAALSSEKNMYASDYEFHLPRPSYMWNTLQSMSKDYPNREFILLIGGDNWNGFNRWYHYEDILANYRIVVYPREDSSLTPNINSTVCKNVSIVRTPLLDISSTEIRNRISNGKPFTTLIPKAVADIIKHDKLYG